MAAYSTSLLHAAATGTGPLGLLPLSSLFRGSICPAAVVSLPAAVPVPTFTTAAFVRAGCRLRRLAKSDGQCLRHGGARVTILDLAAHAPPPPSFPMAMYYNPALKPPSRATHCSITEIVDDGHVEPPKVEVVDDPSPRSVLMPWRRSAALPPQSSGVVGSKPAFNGASNKTPIMICNIPSSFMTKCNKGYVFVNMTMPTAARRLYALLHGHRWAGSAMVCEVVHAHIQGVDALAAHFSHSLFPCGNNKEFLPVRFGPPRDGLRQTAERTIGYTAVRRRLR